MNNPALTTLADVSIFTVGSIDVENNAVLVDVTAFSALSTLTFLANNSLLSNYTALNSVTDIGGSLVFDNLPAVYTLTGLDMLQHIGGDLGIANMPHLVRVTGLTTLAVLDGSCRTPIAGHARVAAGQIQFRGLVLRADGSEVFETEARGAVGDARDLGERAGRELLARLPKGVLP